MHLHRTRRTARTLCLLSAAFSVCLGCRAALAGDGGVYAPALARDPAVQDALEHFYNLDYDGAQQRFEAIQKQHSGDPLATALLLQNVIFRELYREDLLDTTLYAHEGFLAGKHVTQEDPKVHDRVNQLSDQTVGQCDGLLSANPNNVDALYDRAMARSLKATYVGLVERAFVSGLHMALQARDDDAQALKLNPTFVDAKMVVGIHYFVVGALPRTLKIMAGVVGIHGDKSRGIEMLEDCARRGVLTRVESRVALMIFLRHDSRYKEAIVTAESLVQEFPRDYLYALEVANLRKDSGDGPGAIAEYRAVLQAAKQPGYYPNMHPQLAWFGLGETLRGQNDKAGAREAFRNVLAQPNAGADLRKRAQDALNDLQ